MASQSVMSTPIFDELLREMRAGGEGTAEQPKGETAPAKPQPAVPKQQPPQAQQPQPGGRRRRGSD